MMNKIEYKEGDVLFYLYTGSKIWTSRGEWITALTLYTHKSKGMPNIRFAYTPIPMYIRTPRSCLSSVLYFFFSVMLL